MIIAAGTKLYFLKQGKPTLFDENEKEITSLANCQGKLYHATEDGKILQGRKVIGKRTLEPMLITDGDSLYDIAKSLVWTGGTHLNQYIVDSPMFNTLEDREIGKRPNSGLSFVSHEGRLLDGGTFEGIYETKTGRKAVDVNYQASALVSHNSRLITGTTDGRVIDCTANEELKERDQDPVDGFAVHHGKLIHWTFGGRVQDTYSGQQLLNLNEGLRFVFNHNGRTLCAHNRDLIDLETKEKITLDGFVTAILR